MYEGTGLRRTTPAGHKGRARSGSAARRGVDSRSLFRHMRVRELSGFEGKNALRKPPLIMGHEFIGTIEALGNAARASFPYLSPGLPVTVNPLISCGQSQIAQCQLARQQRAVFDCTCRCGVPPARWYGAYDWFFNRACHMPSMPPALSSLPIVRSAAARGQLACWSSRRFSSVASKPSTVPISTPSALLWPNRWGHSPSS